MVLVVEIAIWIIAIVYGVVTIFRLRKQKKEYEEAQRKETEGIAEELRRLNNLPNNDFGQEEKYQRDETIESLIELSDNGVAITLSSLIRTLYDQPDHVLRDIEKGCYGYSSLENSGYKVLNIVYIDKNRNNYNIFIADSEEPYMLKKAKIDDQVIIIRIEMKHEYY